MSEWLDRLLQRRFQKGPDIIKPLLQGLYDAERADLVRRRVVSILKTLMDVEDEHYVKLALRLVTESELVSFSSCIRTGSY